MVRLLLNNSLARIAAIFVISTQICPPQKIFAQTKTNKEAAGKDAANKIIPKQDNTSTIEPTRRDISSLHTGTFGRHLKPILERLRATTDQTNKITGIMESYRDKIEPLRLRYRTVSKTFLDAMIKGSPSQEIMEHQMELARLNSDISNQYCLMSLEIRRCLSDKQVVQYEEYRQQQGWGKRQ